MKVPQSDKPLLMIHEVREWMLDLPLQNYVLTFDDGLYSQFYYHKEFIKFNTPMIYFVSSGIICPEDIEQSTAFPCCDDSHTKAFNGVYEDYMKLSQIQELNKLAGVEIGGHSHSHTRLSLFTNYTDRFKHIIDDTSRMMQWFRQEMRAEPSSFCYPYNEADVNRVYKHVLYKNSITRVYGNERLAIEKLK